MRPGEPRDFESLYRIDQACYPPGIAYSRSTLRSFLSPGALCLVAEASGEIVGFLIAEEAQRRAHIITLDVLATCRRRGVGTALLREAEQQLRARGARQIGLETATENHAAIAFWRKHAYRTRGVIPRYYLGRGDAYAMEKVLPPAQEN